MARPVQPQGGVTPCLLHLLPKLTPELLKRVIGIGCTLEHGQRGGGGEPGPVVGFGLHCVGERGGAALGLGAGQLTQGRPQCGNGISTIQPGDVVHDVLR